MESSIIRIKRLIPAGGINPNTGTPINGLEKAIADFVSQFPLSIVELASLSGLANSGGNIVEMTTMNPAIGIGLLTDVTATDIGVNVATRLPFSENVIESPNKFVATFITLTDGKGVTRVCKVVVLERSDSDV